MPLITQGIMERILVVIAGVFLNIAVDISPLGTFVNKYTIYILIPSIALIIFAKKIDGKIHINNDILILIGSVGLFLAGKKYIIPYIVGNYAYIVMGITILVIALKHKIAEYVLKD